MMSVERKVGKVTKVMPDFIRIHDPKDDNQSLVPGVEFAHAHKGGAEKPD